MLTKFIRYGDDDRDRLTPLSIDLIHGNNVAQADIFAASAPLFQVGLHLVEGLRFHEVHPAAAAMIMPGFGGTSLVTGPRLAAAIAVIPNLHYIRFIQRGPHYIVHFYPLV